jgi:hypothetical protein
MRTGQKTASSAKARHTHTITDQTRLPRRRRPRTASRHDMTRPLRQTRVDQDIAAIGRRRRLSIRAVTTSGIAARTPHRAGLQRSRAKSHASCLSPRETRHGVARWPVRCSAPNDVQVTDNDQIKHAAAHCDLAGPRTQARPRFTLARIHRWVRLVAREPARDWGDGVGSRGLGGVWRVGRLSRAFLLVVWCVVGQRSPLRAARGLLVVGGVGRGGG